MNRVTWGKDLSKPSIAASDGIDEVHESAHRRWNRKGRKVVKWGVPLLADVGNGSVILYSQSIRKR